MQNVCVCVFRPHSNFSFWNIVISEDYCTYWSFVESCWSSWEFIKDTKKKLKFIVSPLLHHHQNSSFKRLSYLMWPFKKIFFKAVWAPWGTGFSLRGLVTWDRVWGLILLAFPTSQDNQVRGQAYLKWGILGVWFEGKTFSPIPSFSKVWPTKS